MHPAIIQLLTLSTDISISDVGNSIVRHSQAEEVKRLAMELQAALDADLHIIQKLNMDRAGDEYLSNGKGEVFDLFVSIRNNFNGSEYEQGKKDGLRLALALLGNVEMLQFNRGNGMAREPILATKPALEKTLAVIRKYENGDPTTPWTIVPAAELSDLYNSLLVANS